LLFPVLIIVVFTVHSTTTTLSAFPSTALKMTSPVGSPGQRPLRIMSFNIWVLNLNIPKNNLIFWIIKGLRYESWKWDGENRQSNQGSWPGHCGTTSWSKKLIFSNFICVKGSEYTGSGPEFDGIIGSDKMEMLAPSVCEIPGHGHCDKA
jgi:hypothetical protein